MKDVLNYPSSMSERLVARVKGSTGVDMLLKAFVKSMQVLNVKSETKAT